MELRKNQSGITLIALVITIIVILIIVSITVYEGTKEIKEVKVETVQTNMLMIKGKVLSYLEEIDAANFGKSNKIDLKKYGFGELSASSKSIYDSNFSISDENIEGYTVTEEALINMGLRQIKDQADKYAVIYNENDYKELDIILIEGIKIDGKLYYSLSKIQALNQETE